MKDILSSIISTSFLVFSLLGIFFFGESRFTSIRKPYYFSPPEVIKYFTFGYNDVYADLLWVRYIQNADFCSYDKGIPVYDGKTKFNCNKGWAFHMANAVTELAPRFKRPYITSSVMMGIIMGDKEGARLILDKAVKQFTKDWDVFFHTGHHYLLELNQPSIAAELLLTAARLGGPYWLYSLSAKLYSESGRIDVAEQMMIKMIEDDPNGPFVKTYKRRLSEIRKLKEK